MDKMNADTWERDGKTDLDKNSTQQQRSATWIYAEKRLKYETQKSKDKIFANMML